MVEAPLSTSSNFLIEHLAHEVRRAISRRLNPDIFPINQGALISVKKVIPPPDTQERQHPKLVAASYRVSRYIGEM